jgi:uncharacterized membrane protein
MLLIPSAIDRRHATVVVLLTMAYIMGIIGFQVPVLLPYIRPLAPTNLVVSLILLLAYHTDWQPTFGWFAIPAMLIGFFVEVLGVKTGQIFGHYQYGLGLGGHLWGVPPVLAVNWLLLTYCCGSVTARLPFSTWIKAALAATLMVVLDVFIEPVAIKLDFWTWFGQPVPVQNYVAWWFVSFGLMRLWFILPFEKENRLAGWLLGLQFLFFGVQFLLMT